MTTSLPCGYELLRLAGAFHRLFGLVRHDRRRSRSVTTSTGVSRHKRSAVGRCFASVLLRFDAREAACDIEPCLEMFGNIQGTENTEIRRGDKRYGCCDFL